MVHSTYWHWIIHDMSVSSVRHPPLHTNVQLFDTMRSNHTTTCSFITSLQQGCKVLRWSCLYICLHAYLKKQRPNFLYVLTVAAARSSSDDVMYFRFCGRRHVRQTGRILKSYSPGAARAAVWCLRLLCFFWYIRHRLAKGVIFWPVLVCLLAAELKKFWVDLHEIWWTGRLQTREESIIIWKVTVGVGI